MATTQLTTAEDLWLMPDDGWRYELVDGVLHRMSPAGDIHGETGGDVIGYLWLYARGQRRGVVYNSETGFIISRDPDTVLSPDAAFVRRDRLPPRAERTGFVRVIPDLVVEIVSPSNSARDIADKVRRYLDAGVLLIWVIDAWRRTVVAHAPGKASRECGEGDILDGGDVLPGFRLALADLFRE